MVPGFAWLDLPIGFARSRNMNVLERRASGGG